MNKFSNKHKIILFAILVLLTLAFLVNTYRYRTIADIIGSNDFDGDYIVIRSMSGHDGSLNHFTFPYERSFLSTGQIVLDAEVADEILKTILSIRVRPLVFHQNTFTIDYFHVDIFIEYPNGYDRIFFGFRNYQHINISQVVDGNGRERGGHRIHSSDFNTAIGVYELLMSLTLR